MAHRLMDWIDARATGRAVTIAFGVTLAINAPLAYYTAAVHSIAPGSTIPDMLGFVSQAELLEALDALGEAGREAYLPVAAWDLVYPLVYGSLMTLCLAWGLRERFTSRPKLRVTLLLPSLAILADYVENLSVLSVLSQWPDAPASTLALATAGHTVKWLLVITSAVLSLIALFTGLRRTRQQ